MAQRLAFMAALIGCAIAQPVDHAHAGKRHGQHAAATAAPSTSYRSQDSGQLRAWWNQADPTFSHISYDSWLVSEAALIAKWRSWWLNRLPAEPGQVAEYGIGAGLLGQYVLSGTRARATHYTGIDVSDRQLMHASKRLGACSRCVGRFSLRRTDALTSALLDGVETFVCQAVIQHFPDHDYLHAFLQALNGAPSVRWAMLQVRETGCGARGKPNADYGSTPVVFKVCAHLDELAAPLSNFRHVWSSPVIKGNNYVFHTFERRL